MRKNGDALHRKLCRKMVALYIENYAFSKECFFSCVQCIHMETYMYFNAFITMQQLTMLYILYDNRLNNANIFNVGDRLTACLCGKKYP